MKFIIKVSKNSLLHCFLIIIFTTVPITSFAQDVIDVVDTSSPWGLLVEPDMVMTQTTIDPDCHTYTGCGLIVVRKHYYQKPIIHKVKHYKRHRVYYPPCCVVTGCYVRPVGQCW